LAAPFAASQLMPRLVDYEQKILDFIDAFAHGMV
jgi:hypothetical protein